MRRGFTLLAIMALSALWLTLFLGMALLADSVQRGTTDYKYALKAESMARSGLEYGLAMLARGRWKEPRHYQSPRLGQGESFTLDVRREGTSWKVRSTGCSGWRQLTLEGHYP